MAEQFLDGAQIGAGAQQMRGEGMAQRMRRRRVGQAERGARARAILSWMMRGLSCLPRAPMNSGSSDPSFSGHSDR